MNRLIALNRLMSRLTLWVAATLIVIILAAVLLQSIARTLGYVVLGTEEVARFAMAISGFSGLQYAFTSGSNIRMTLVINRLHGRARHALELFIAIVLAVVIAWTAYYWLVLTNDSYLFGDTAGGVVSVPAFYIQAPMGLGLFALLFSSITHILSLMICGTSEVIEDDQEVHSG